MGEEVDWMDPAQDRNKWRVVLNTVVNVWVSWSAARFLTFGQCVKVLIEIYCQEVDRAEVVQMQYIRVLTGLKWFRYSVPGSGLHRTCLDLVCQEVDWTGWDLVNQEVDWTELV